MKCQFKKLKILIFISLSVVMSCSKNNETDNQPLSGTYVSIRLNNAEVDEQIQKIGSSKVVASPNYQTGNISSNDGCELVYELVEENNYNSEKGLQVNRAVLSGSTSSKAIVKKEPLTQGIKYRVLVYNDDNTLKFDQIYSYSTTNPININLDAGKEYTFIIYSFNKTTALSENSLLNKENLSTASLANISEELLFYKNKVNLAYGANTLNVALKYMFTTISTTVSVDRENIFGPITSLTNAFLKPTRSNATLPLETGILSYGTENTSGQQIIFPTIPTAGVNTITSSTVSKLINPVTSNGKFLLEKIVIDGKEKKNLTIDNIKITPGVRYKLNLTFKTCTETLTENIFNWDYKGLAGTDGSIRDNTGAIRNRGYELKNKVTAKGSDFGYIMNITKLDNSLNMEINSGTTKLTISPSEIQFDPFAGAQNIRFKDGDRHQKSGVSAIYNMTGTVQNPVVRIAIDVNGNVRFFAKKTQSNNTLYEMELFNPTTGARIPFNKVNWKPKGQINEVTVTQKVDNTTTLIGVGYAKNIVSCASIK